MTILRKAPLFLFALVFAIVVGAGETRIIPNEYNVDFTEEHTLEKHFEYIGQVIPNVHTYYSIKGYNAIITEELLPLVQSDPNVVSVTPNKETLNSDDEEFWYVDDNGEPVSIDKSHEL